MADGPITITGIAFARSSGSQQLLVLASLNDAPFDPGYVVGAPAGGMAGVFNSDAAIYGGSPLLRRRGYLLT
jgi:hypothetical protein